MMRLTPTTVREFCVQADGGNSWSLIPTTSDQIFAFTGEGFAGFAWSTANPQLVVAAVSQAYGGTVVNAERPYTSYAGLYYSLDSGLNWSLARITDGATGDVQGPLDALPPLMEMPRPPWCGIR